MLVDKEKTRSSNWKNHTSSRRANVV